jgi:hypothetical protein
MQQVSGGTGVVFTPKLLIKNSLGNLRHVAKSELKENLPFSEIYFSEVKSKTIKAWKFHSQQPTILLTVTDLSHDYAENLSLPLEYPEFITLINEFGN